MERSSVTSSCTRDLLEEFFEKMKLRDDVYVLVKTDTLTRLYAYTLLEEGRHISDVSWTIRLLGKLLIVIRELSGQDNLKWMDMINCCQWKHLIDGVKSLSDFTHDKEGISVGKPNIAIKCGQCIKGIVATARGHALHNDDNVMLEKTRKMFELYDHEWGKVAKHCHIGNKTRKEDKTDLLPLTTDVTKLRDYCISQIQEISSVVQLSGCDAKNYLSLAKVTLTRLITFNARRGGEPGKLKINVWAKIKEGNWVHEEEIERLPEEEKVLAKRLLIGYVIGKGMKKVPILFPPETVQAIDLLLSHRESVITQSNNPYVFARIYKNSSNYLRGSDCVRQVCGDAGLEKGDLFTATQMRKYLSTTLQLIVH